jgi:UDP-N-acetylenolpyruvoylglucosamine reductase
VRGLIELARDKVRESSGVVLEPEVRLVGEW